ncbi:MAG: hypothetical protein R2746_04600 [Acidimicrobiales bacterium]
MGLGVLEVSPDGNWLAYAVDRAGDERHALRFRDLRTGEESPETVPEVSYGFAWAADSATCWYTLQDEMSRPHRVLRHVVGADPAADVEVFREDDERFHVHVAPSRSQAVVVISAGSAITSELAARRPRPRVRTAARGRAGAGRGVLGGPPPHRPARGLEPRRRRGLRPLAGSARQHAAASRHEWEELLAHEPGRRIAGVEAFADHVVVHGRADGVTALWPWTRRRAGSGGSRPTRRWPPSGPAPTPSFETDTYRLSYQSLTTPPSVFDEDLATGERTLLKRLPVLDGFDRSRYESAREWATAPDGTRVPISLVWRPDRQPADDPAPLVLYGYGA